jgi:hypothetical protein
MGELCLEVDLIYIRSNSEVKVDFDSFWYRKGERRVNLQIWLISLSSIIITTCGNGATLKGTVKNTAVPKLSHGSGYR